MSWFGWLKPKVDDGTHELLDPETYRKLNLRAKKPIGYGPGRGIWEANYLGRGHFRYSGYRWATWIKQGQKIIVRFGRDFPSDILFRRRVDVSIGRTWYRFRISKKLRNQLVDVFKDRSGPELFDSMSKDPVPELTSDEKKDRTGNLSIDTGIARDTDPGKVSLVP